MIKTDQTKDMGFSLLTIIVSRGKASKILAFAREHGARDVSCFLGKGTIKNPLLKMIEMDAVEKEIIMIVVPSAKEDEILNQLNTKFHFERPHHGIAFTTSLAGVLQIKRDTTVRWNSNCLPMDCHGHCQYTVLFIVVDKGRGEQVIRISQEAGYYGGTIIKARGAASRLNLVLDMVVEPEKEAVLMLLESDRANQLTNLLRAELHLGQANKGMLVKIGVSKTLGLYQNTGKS